MRENTFLIFVWDERRWCKMNIFVSKKELRIFRIVLTWSFSGILQPLKTSGFLSHRPWLMQLFLFLFWSTSPQHIMTFLDSSGLLSLGLCHNFHELFWLTKLSSFVAALFYFTRCFCATTSAVIKSAGNSKIRRVRKRRALSQCADWLS